MRVDCEAQPEIKKHWTNELHGWKALNLVSCLLSTTTQWEKGWRMWQRARLWPHACSECKRLHKTTKTWFSDVDVLPFLIFLSMSHNHFWNYCYFWVKKIGGLALGAFGRELINEPTWWSQQKTWEDGSKGHIRSPNSEVMICRHLIKQSLLPFPAVYVTCLH